MAALIVMGIHLFRIAFISALVMDSNPLLMMLTSSGQSDLTPIWKGCDFTPAWAAIFKLVSPFCSIK